MPPGQAEGAPLGDLVDAAVSRALGERFSAVERRLDAAERAAGHTAEWADALRRLSALEQAFAEDRAAFEASAAALDRRLQDTLTQVWMLSTAPQLVVPVVTRVPLLASSQAAGAPGPASAGHATALDARHQATRKLIGVRRPARH